MKRLYLILLVLLSLFACNGQSGKVAQPTSTPQPNKVELAKRLLAQKNFEEAAVTFRDALDDLESQGVPLEEQKSTQELCTTALVEAGGFIASKRLWLEIRKKNPDSASEATRMVTRAKGMMLMQADELTLQAKDDLTEKKKSKALSTVRAALVLYKDAEGSKDQIGSAEKLEKEILKPDPL